MLKQLRIHNLVLVESAEINFQGGLNVLSGETGSGKSAIMNALNLITGERADVGLIRRDADKGIVEALFDVDKIPSIHRLLEESGIDHDRHEDLILRREISISGKSRALINNQLVQQALLRKVCAFLLDIVGQHANQKLLSTDAHRTILDLFGDLKSELSDFAKKWSEENALRSELEQLIQSESQRLREIEVCSMELEELQEAKLKEGEDEELFGEYTLLSNSEELASKVNEILQGLAGEKSAALTVLNKQKQAFEALVRIDPCLAEAHKAFQNAYIELQEISYSLRNYQAHIEYNPERIASVNERLSLISRLKRKYGSSMKEIQAYQTKTQERLEILQNADAQIADLRLQLGHIENQNNTTCLRLNQLRVHCSQKFEKALVKQLRALNMPKVEFHVEITSQKRNRFGDDHIEFYLTPNVGEHRIPIKECASGGELSRIMLALQTLLAGKEQIPTMIFDEIDANIGGETAVIVGEKLREIGSKHQVLCITHFHQVAKHASHHLQIAKKEKNGRTITSVKALNDEERQLEFARMLGG